MAVDCVASIRGDFNRRRRTLNAFNLQLNCGEQTEIEKRPETDRTRVLELRSVGDTCSLEQRLKQTPFAKILRITNSRRLMPFIGHRYKCSTAVRPSKISWAPARHPELLFFSPFLSGWANKFIGTTSPRWFKKGGPEKVWFSGFLLARLSANPTHTFCGWFLPFSLFTFGHIFFTFMSGILSYHTLVFAVRAKNARGRWGVVRWAVWLCRPPPTRLKMP